MEVLVDVALGRPGCAERMLRLYGWSRRWMRKRRCPRSPIRSRHRHQRL